MNTSEKEQLVKKISENSKQLAALAIGLMVIGYDCQTPAYSLLQDAEVDHIGAIKSFGQIITRLQDENNSLTEQLILEM